MTGIIIEFCTRNKTEDLEQRLEKDVEDFAIRGLRALAVACEELDDNDYEAEGTALRLSLILPVMIPSKPLMMHWLLVFTAKPVTGDQLTAAVLDWETTCTLRRCRRTVLPPEASSATLTR